jgi:putative transcriptional regulator
MERRRDGTTSFARSLACLTVAALLAVGVPARASQTDSTGPASPAPGKLVGRLLVAAPHMPDPSFAKTVIFMVRHNDHGAMGLIINRPIAIETAATLMERLVGKGPSIDGERKIRIHFGGPVRFSKGVFIHSGDYVGAGAVKVTDRVSVTKNPEILRDLANGKGPRHGFLAMGFAGWSAGQLEAEMQRKDWIVVKSDSQLVFDDDMKSKWRRAMDKLGVDL